MSIQPLHIETYSLWKTFVQANSFTVYELRHDATSRTVWAGTRDFVYSTDVIAANFADYSAAFTPVEIKSADEAIASIINFETVDVPRAADKTPLQAARQLQLGQTAFLRTDIGAELINVDGSPSGTTLVVWNGTGVSDTGGDWTASGDGSESSSADAGSGTNGWDSGAVGANDFTNFNNGSAIDVAGTYDTLRFQLQPKAYPGNAQLQIQWRNAATTVVGVTLNVSDYTTNMDLDVWQQVEIPIADFALTENVQNLRIVYKVGNQQHWIDDIELQAAGGGGPYTFQVAAPDATVAYHMSMMVLVLSGSAAGWNPNTFANISALTNGLLIRQRRVSTGEVLWKLNTKDNTDLFGRFHPQDDITFADGSLLVGFMIKPGRASVVVTNDDVLEVVVRDNLSGLTSARAYMHYGVEDL